MSSQLEEGLALVKQHPESPDANERWSGQTTEKERDRPPEEATSAASNSSSFLRKSAPPAAAASPPRRTNLLQVSAMLALLSSGYNVVGIASVLLILEYLDPDSAGVISFAVSTLLVGVVIGQIIGGVLGDSPIGRLGALRRMLLVVIIAALGSATIDTTIKTYVQLGLWRFLLGIGLGGVYPLAAVLSVEQAPELTAQPQRRGTGPKQQEEEANRILKEKLRRVGLTYSMQGVGFLLVPVVAISLLYSKLKLDQIWRIILAMGALPGIIFFILQLFIIRNETESTAGEDDNNNNNNSDSMLKQPLSEHQSAGQAPQEEEDTRPILGSEGWAEDEEQSSAQLPLRGEETNMPSPTPDDNTLPTTQPPPRSRLEAWRYALTHESNLFRKLMATGVNFFLFDVLFYGNNVFQLIVIADALEQSSSTSLITGITVSSTWDLYEKKTFRTAADNSLLLALLGLPGYFVAAYFMGSTVFGIRLTPRYLMLQGFGCMTVLYLTIAVFWDSLGTYPEFLIFLYALTFFFSNFGPNTVCYVLPSLIFSHDCRSTLNGVAAAMGKVGSLVGAMSFAPIITLYGTTTVMYLCTAVAFLGFVNSYIFVDKDVIPHTDATTK